MFKKLFASGLVFFFSLGLFKYADAHVTINPKVVEPGSYEKWMFEYLLNKKIILKKSN